MSEIVITDQDINEVESILAPVKFDGCRREIIKRMDSFDVQAFPGSGKTTVVVGKLLCLLRNWDQSFSGICVLSHTNAAKDEIEARVNSSVYADLNTGYPHFIGTIQSFVDTFLAIPWLRSNGYPIRIIDEELTLTKRLRRLKEGSTYLRKKNAEHKCSASAFPIEIDIGCKKGPAYNDVLSSVTRSFQAGYFTFNEMMLVAQNALDENPHLIPALQKRFPIVFIDEAQDTNDMQWNIIERVFPRGGNSVIQRYGDANQAIYDSDKSVAIKERFPLHPIMSIPDSKRFGKAIATIADLAADKYKGLLGTNTTYDRLQTANTLFLFSRKHISEVIPTYARLVLRSFTDEELRLEEKHGIYVIGHVHKNEPSEFDDKKFPVGIRDYWRDYKPRLTGSSPKPERLVEYFWTGESLETELRRNMWIIDGIRKLFLRNSIYLPQNKHSINSLLNQVLPERHLEFRSDLLGILYSSYNTEEAWKRIVNEICEFAQKWYRSHISQADPFLSWREESKTTTTKEALKGDVNVFRYEDPSGRSIDIHLSSIHAVKGRTHLATLVLDTFWKERNIPRIIPFLTGKKSDTKGKQDAYRLKTHYVALTRAKGLVCMAMPIDSVEKEDIEVLQSLGWKIELIQ